MQVQSSSSRITNSASQSAFLFKSIAAASSRFPDSLSVSCSPCSLPSIDSSSSGSVLPFPNPITFKSNILDGIALTLNRTPPFSIPSQNEIKKKTNNGTQEMIVKSNSSAGATTAVSVAAGDDGNDAHPSAPAQASAGRSPPSVAAVCGLRKVRRFHNLKASFIEQQYLHVSPKDQIASFNEEEETDCEYEVPSSFSLSPSVASVRARSFLPSIQPARNLSLPNPELVLTTTSSSPSSFPSSPVPREDEDLQFSLDLELGPPSFIPLGPLSPFHQPMKPSNLDVSLSNWKFRTRNYFGHQDHFPLPLSSCSASVWNKDDLYFAPHSPLLSESPASVSHSPPPISNVIDPSRVSHHNKSAPCVIPTASNPSSATSSSSSYASTHDYNSRRSNLLTNQNRDMNWFKKLNDLEDTSRRRSTTIPNKKEGMTGHKERTRPRTAPEDHDCQFEIEL